MLKFICPNGLFGLQDAWLSRWVLTFNIGNMSLLMAAGLIKLNLVDSRRLIIFAVTDPLAK